MPFQCDICGETHEGLPDIGFKWPDPYFGWLSNRIPFYDQDTLALKTRAVFQGGKQRPLIELAPYEHPLYLDYSNGVTLDRAWQYAHWQSAEN